MKRKFAFSLVVIVLSVSSLQAQLNMSFLGNVTYTPDLSDIWGYVDSLGNEYALVGVGNGVSVVDVTTPTSPSEVFFINGPSSTWRDLKVWNKHLYVTNESSGGLMIIDLSNLPSSSAPTVVSYSGSTYPFTKAHDLYIDENGVAYIMGSNNGAGGAIMLDLTNDPKAPIELGRFNSYYLHDGMVRGDTLWGAAINSGVFVVVDVSNKSSTTVLATQATPSNFTHNCWISDDGNYLFTTDEKSNAFIASYDVSNLSNITLVDQIQSNPGSNVIVHNTYVISNHLVSSYYRDGVTIHDITRPNNMIQTGNYDTSPSFSGNGYNGAWGVYPWLPSGNVLVSDIENGLFILGASYIQGCYLEGTVTDSMSGTPINGATISILSTSVTTISDTSGIYATATLTSGIYDVRFSAPGYISDTLPATLSNGVLTIIDAVLLAPTPFTLTGQVIEASMGGAISGASVTIINSDFTYNVTTDGSGNFTITPFYGGTYDVLGGKWLFRSTCFNMYIDSINTVNVIELDSGIYDDFTFNYGWTVSGSATVGVWEKGEPVGTTFGSGDANPDFDVTTDCHDEAYITGNTGGGVGDDDVDNGNTILSSPIFDITQFTEPYVNYYRWFFNDGGSGTPNDVLEVRLYNGITSAIVETVTEATAGNGTWVQRSIRVSDFIAVSSTMQLTFETSDLSGSGHIVEAGVDQFEVGDYGLVTSFSNAMCFGICDGEGVAQVVGGQSPFTYFWDDPGTQSNATATGLCAGLYNILVIDAAGDSATSTVSINQPNQISLSITTTPTCIADVSDASVIALAGVVPYTYMWSDSGSQTTQTATGLSMATYTVTVTDNNGCSNSESVSIGSSIAISVSATGSDPTNCGGADGSSSAVVVDGSSPYTYLWNDPGMQTNASAVGMLAGSYKVIVTDNDGCVDSANVTLAEGVVAPLQMIDSTLVSCIGPNSGSATVEMNGGSSPYSYSWNTTPVQTDSVATGLSVGSYIATIVDNNGCSNTLTVNISAAVDVSVSASAVSPTACGAADGTATATVANGLAPYTYLWNDPSAQTTTTAAGLLSGSYAVTVTDMNGCTDSASVPVDDPGAPVLSLASSTMISCFGESDGAATVSATGGTTPYTYAWGATPVQSNSTAVGLSAGTYAVSVTDSGSCSSSISVIITEPDVVVVDITGSDLSCFESNNGVITAAVNGGTTPYTYTWNTGDSTVPLINLSAGIYILTVSDANGCASFDSTLIMEPVEMVLNNIATIDDAGACQGELTVIVNGGIPPYDYLWDDSLAQTTATADCLCAGMFSCTVTDSTGCSVISSSESPSFASIGDGNLLESSISIFPNPNNGAFTIEMKFNIAAEVELEVINAIGQILYTEKILSTRSHVLNLSNASPGIYQLRIVASTEIIQKRVVICH